MKISQFNPVRNAEVAKDLSIVDPLTNEPIVDDKGNEVTFVVKGFLSKQFRDTNENLPEDMDKTERGAKLLVALIDEIPKNLENENGEKVTKKNLEQFLKDEKWVANQIEQFVIEPANFRPKM